MRGGNPYCTLPAGYLGSSFWGGLMIFAGFNVLASRSKIFNCRQTKVQFFKVVSIIIGVAMLATLFWAKGWLTRLITVIFIGFTVFLWWFRESIGLRYFVLFFGVMVCFNILFCFLFFYILVWAVFALGYNRRSYSTES